MAVYRRWFRSATGEDRYHPTSVKKILTHLFPLYSILICFLGRSEIHALISSNNLRWDLQAFLSIPNLLDALTSEGLGFPRFFSCYDVVLRRCVVAVAPWILSRKPLAHHPHDTSNDSSYLPPLGARLISIFIIILSVYCDIKYFVLAVEKTIFYSFTQMTST